MLNDARARAFGRPTLRSLAPDAVLLGYSITRIDGEDLVVESNHVLRSSLTEPAPVSFTTRTWKAWVDPEVEWRFHAMDHVMNTSLSWRNRVATRTARSELEHVLGRAKRAPALLLVDGERVPGLSFEFESTEFLRAFWRSSMISVAAPAEILPHGFISLPRGTAAATAETPR